MSPAPDRILAGWPSNLVADRANARVVDVGIGGIHLVQDLLASSIDALFVLDAVDFAFEYLEAESPERLRIFRILGRKREEVWAYGPEAAVETEEQPRDLIDVYGYDVMHWRGPGG